MTLTQITLWFLAIISVIGIAMLVHSWIDKGRIRKDLLRLSSTSNVGGGGELSGKVRQENPLVYPHFSGEIGGRRFDLFFQVVKAGRHHILYLIYNVKSTITVDLLLVKSDYFKPIVDETQFASKAGGLLPDLDTRYQIRSKNPEEARQIFEQGGLKKRLESFDEFSSLQLGPDAIVMGKPYDGPSDTELSHIVQTIRAIQKLAEAMEQSSRSVEVQGGVPV